MRKTTASAPHVEPDQTSQWPRWGGRLCPACEQLKVAQANPGDVTTTVMKRIPRREGHVVTRPEVGHATQERFVLHASGLGCARCVERVRRALVALPGVNEVNIMLGSGGESTITVSATGIDDDRLAGALEDAGPYQVR